MKYKYLITKEGHVEMEHGEIQSDRDYNEDNMSVLAEEQMLRWKDTLLDIARKQLIGDKLLYTPKEIKQSLDEMFEEGKKATLKDMPKWKKLGGGAMGGTDKHLFLIRSSCGYYFTSPCIGPNDVYIELEELEKLPKEL